MPRAIIVALAALALAAVLSTGPAHADLGEFAEVVGVQDDDMLKMRAGPGTGYKVIVGLPNGTVLRVHDCQRVGGTKWCRVSLKQARALKGYVAWHYLRDL
jgi:uncharacterized protein YraI